MILLYLFVLKQILFSAFCSLVLRPSLVDVIVCIFSRSSAGFSACRNVCQYPAFDVAHTGKPKLNLL
jgi:hypothetical protein